MRHRNLHAALQAFAEEAAWQLAADTADGAEVPFELAEVGGLTGARWRPGGRRDTPLYCYRPLTDRFVRERGGVLGRLPAYPAAAQALAALDGVGDYLRAQGERRVPVAPRERADAALGVFVSRIFADATEFVLTAERLERAYRELEDAVFAGRAESLVVAPLLGVKLASAEVALGEGLSLVVAEALDEDLPDLPGAEAARTLALLTTVNDPGAPAPLSTARARFARLVRALRLFDTAAPAVGPMAWVRTGAGAWRAASLPLGSGRARGTLSVPPDAEDELRAFCSLVARRTPRAGELAWALARFEMACERSSAFDALTDHLLALRALLEPEGPASGRLPTRLAALCATPEDRTALAERAAHAVSLERAVVAGLTAPQPALEELVEELAGHLRALLRDVLCGHLDADLRAVADELCASVASP